MPRRLNKLRLKGVYQLRAVRSPEFSPAHTAAGAHLPHLAKAMWGRPESTALGSDKGLDVLYSTPARFVSLAPCIFGHLHFLASCSGKKSRLAEQPAGRLTNLGVTEAEHGAVKGVMEEGRCEAEGHQHRYPCAA